MTLKRFTRRASLLVFVAACSIGCGGSRPAEPGTPAGAAATATETPGAEAAAEGSGAPASAEHFDAMAPAEKLRFMKEVVAPQMAKTFQAFDAEHFADFGCVACHGAGAKDGIFEMPTPSLPKLPADLKPIFEKQPEVATFMAEQVVPQMAKLLGEEPYSAETGRGFGCFDCHQKQ